MASPRNLAHIGRGGAVLAADREALREPRDEEQRRCQRADRRIGRQHSDHQRAGAHQQHRRDHRGTPTVPVGHPAEQPSAERPHEEADREDAGRREQLACRIAGRKEGWREIDRSESVCVEVVPLDEVARGSAHDRNDALAPLRSIGDRAVEHRRWRARHGRFSRSEASISDAPSRRLNQPSSALGAPQSTRPARGDVDELRIAWQALTTEVRCIEVANLLPGHRDNATSRPDRPLPRSDRPDPTLGFEGTAAFDPTLSRADSPLPASFRRWTASTQRPTWVSSNRSEGRASPRDWTVAAVFEDTEHIGGEGS